MIEEFVEARPLADDGECDWCSMPATLDVLTQEHGGKLRRALCEDCCEDLRRGPPEPSDSEYRRALRLRYPTQPDRWRLAC